MLKTVRALAGAATLLLAAPAGPITAADLSVPPPVAAAHAEPNCGPCGCLQITYVYHPALESTYGLRFDPRNDDQTEPHYYYGRARAYPRYFVDGVPVPVPGSC